VPRLSWSSAGPPRAELRGKLPLASRRLRASSSLENMKYTKMRYLKIKIFLSQRGPAKMFPRAPLWLLTGLVVCDIARTHCVRWGFLTSMGGHISRVEPQPKLANYFGQLLLLCVRTWLLAVVKVWPMFLRVVSTQTSSAFVRRRSRAGNVVATADDQC